jgi:hypothetical protein
VIDPLARTTQERIVLPKIEAAQARIEELEQLDPLIDDLGTSRPVRATCDALRLQQQRQVVQALLVPSVEPVPRAERGRQGLDVNTRRVAIRWRNRG